MNTLEEWLTAATESLGLRREDLDRDLVLDLARDVAHGVARPAAPLTTFLLGLAAGRGGVSPEQVRQQAARLSALADGFADRDR